MPSLPSPYEMRDWKKVAKGYDSLVFDLNRTGQYLPLIRINSSPVNYPSHNSFGLHTVVGTNSPQSGEAINCLPAVIGATLAGIDKSNQNGYNWVLMCEEWFNKRPEQNVYKNHPVDDTYDDWWYITMPNVFFYQLYDLYPNTGNFNFQFRSVADQWLKAMRALGGKTTPWKAPNMNYRGFDLRNMTAYSSGVPEPEAAGAIAWILYNAYLETKVDDYRIGAEWAIEFLNAWSSNPSYELQLAYGTYIAARMNAELGTEYDVEKFLNWCFDIGPLRQWGSILGTWGGINVSGLIGESISNDYAFSMNTFEQIGALVPLVRYDDRFARAIGKWVLNAANASRLFYTNYLPGFKQDSEEWAYQYDPESYLAHEALREEGLGGWSPYATGDAIEGGWGATNLTLYSSSHVGILGGIISKTNIDAILQLDLLKTDYFHTDTYPSYLYYNPYSENKVVEISLGPGSYDIYDCVSNSFLSNGVGGTTNIIVPGDGSVIAVIIPAGSNIEYNLNKMIVNGKIIDYDAGQSVENYPPRIKSLSPEKSKVLISDTLRVFCTAEDKDNDDLLYSWSASSGEIIEVNSSVYWIAPGLEGNYAVYCSVDDGKGAFSSDTTYIEVVGSLNQSPAINKLTAQPRKIHPGTESLLTCFAEDPEGDEISYSWFSDSGEITGTGMEIVWTAPAIEGNYTINCYVEDNLGGSDLDSIIVSVRDTTQVQSGELVAFYPFNNSANDESGNNNNGTASGVTSVADRHGNANSAFYFDGLNDFIRIPVNTILNFQNAITINFWIKSAEFFEREAYPLSHGNWENRWKVSITNKKIRWTIKTSSGIKDLDSEIELEPNKLYNVCALYNGRDIELYIDGELDAFSDFSGTLLTTPIDLMIGQVLPNNTEYNFKGTLDDIRIYNYAISYNRIKNLYDIPTSLRAQNTIKLPVQNNLYQNYPNPFNAATLISFDLKELSYVNLEIYDLLGRKIRTVLSEEKSPGYYKVEWEGLNDYGIQVATGIYIYSIKTGKFSASKKIVYLK